MESRYVGLLHPGRQGSEWGVTFPDFPGCVASGRTAVEAAENADAALSSHIALMLADGDPIPAFRDQGELKASGEIDEDLADGAMFVLVRVANLPAPKERINITIDRDVLRRVDEAARREGVSRSSFIEKAAERQASELLALADELERSLVEIEQSISGRYTTTGPRSLRLPRKKSA